MEVARLLLKTTGKKNVDPNEVDRQCRLDGVGAGGTGGIPDAAVVLQKGYCVLARPILEVFLLLLGKLDGLFDLSMRCVVG